MNDPRIETLRLRVEPFRTDFQRRWSWPNLANGLLNAAEKHASARQFGGVQVQQKHHAWVLSRLAIDMLQVPRIDDDVCINTWIQSVYHFFTNRCFSVTAPDGTVYGYAHSIWALIDMQTRQPQALANLPENPLEQYTMPEEPCLVDRMSRIKPLDDDEFQRTIPTEYSDIDFNGHVNSVKYIEHIINLFTLNDFSGRRNLRRFEISYIAESVFGDTLDLYRRRIDNNTYEVEIRKNHTGQALENEAVVRSKLIFGNEKAPAQPTTTNQ